MEYGDENYPIYGLLMFFVILGVGLVSIAVFGEVAALVIVGVLLLMILFVERRLYLEN